MTRYSLDATDLAIIEMLREDGRASLARIGEAVDLSADAVRIRLTRLTADGVARVVGIVHPSSLGYGVLASAMIEYRGPLHELAAELQQYPQVTFMAVTLGDFNATCEIAAIDDQALSDFINNTIRGIDRVERVESWRVLDVVKWEVQGRPPPPSTATDSELARTPLDELDMRILRVLTESPRSTYRELEQSVDAPYSVVRRRAQGLFQSGAIVATVVVDLVTTYPRVMALVLLQLGKGAGEALEYATNASEVHIVIRVSGRYNALLEVACNSPEHLADFLGRLLEQDGVRQVTSYLMTHFSILPMPWALAGHTPLSPYSSNGSSLTASAIGNGNRTGHSTASAKD